MTSRERLTTTLNHRQPDHVCVDFGGTWISGIHTSIVRQELVDQDHLNPDNNLEEFGLLSAADIAHYQQQVAWLDHTAADTGVVYR